MIETTRKMIIIMEYIKNLTVFCILYVHVCRWLFDLGIHYIGEMETRTLGRTLFEQISDGQVQWAPLDKNFDTVSFML